MNSENLPTEHSITAEIKLYYDLFVPKVDAKPLPLLLSIHGYGAHKRYMMREGQAVAPENFVVASLQGFYQHFRPKRDNPKDFRIGFNWLTNYKAEESVALHHKFVIDVIEKLVNDGIVNRDKIFLLGFSQACALNFRFALTHPEILRGIVGICGGIPGDLETSELYQTSNADAFYLYNTQDEFYELENYQDGAEKLKNRFAGFDSKCYQAKHEITDEMRIDVKNWLNNF